MDEIRDSNSDHCEETTDDGIGDLYEREWKRHDEDGKVDNSSSLSVMQFNVLADGLCALRPDKGLFDRSPAPSLEWSFRRGRLLQEILSYQPDILCCQEMDHFADFFQPELEKHNYQGLFSPKRSSPCLQVSSEPDGCAIFFKTTTGAGKFRLKETSVKTLYFQNQNQLALIVVLVWKNESEIVIVTTHLKAQKDREGEDIRTAETQELLQYLQEEYPSHPIVIAADLNATPPDACSTAYPSRVYPLLNDYQYQSTYESVLGHEVAYSTWKSRHGQGTPVKHTIDYIWCSRRHWKILACLDVPERLDRELLPSYRYGSDHFALMAEISLFQGLD